MGANELPIRSGMANISYSATKSDGGRLLLTNQRLIFFAHAININPNLYWEISLKDVDRAELGLNILISQRINIYDKKDCKVILVVYGGKYWIKEINLSINKSRLILN